MEVRDGDLDTLLLLPALKKEGGKTPLLLATDCGGSGSSRMGKGVSWQRGTGEAGSGETSGMRGWTRVEGDLLASVSGAKTSRCSDSRPQGERRGKKGIYMLFFRSIYSGGWSKQAAYVTSVFYKTEGS